MDAHFRYFKLGYELFNQIEPLIQEVLTYAQHAKEAANDEQDKLAKRIQEYRTQVEMDNLHATTNTEASTSIDATRPVSMSSSYKGIQAIMLSSPSGRVRTIKQGYLLKRPSNLKTDWKRQFFVLDSRGTLYYYRTKGPKSMVPHSNQSTARGEHNNGMFGRLRNRHTRTLSWSGESIDCRTVNLRTSSIKIDAEDTDLRLCFRIIMPNKSYTLQAETEADRMEWVDKIIGVKTSLLSTPLPDELIDVEKPPRPMNEKHKGDFVSNSLSDDRTSQSNLGKEMGKQTDYVSELLREIPGNDKCAECSALDPDWASLNLGILMCIQCSGVHRKLGVHISKIRSITLDVKVWEPIILKLFQALGNAYCNSVWEEQLFIDQREVESESSAASIEKPSPFDPFKKKEKYIQMKYAEKLFIRDNSSSSHSSHADALWEAVRTSNLREAYRMIAISDASTMHTTFDEIHSVDASSPKQEDLNKDEHQLDPATCPKLKPGEPENCLRGCSLLHLACHVGNAEMIELLLQFGADVNMRDFHGRTPLHHCIAKRDNQTAKYLARRGAKNPIKDWGGRTPLERAVELGSIKDDQLFLLLAQQE